MISHFFFVNAIFLSSPLTDLSTHRIFVCIQNIFFFSLEKVDFYYFSTTVHKWQNECKMKWVIELIYNKFGRISHLKNNFHSPRGGLDDSHWNLFGFVAAVNATAQ